MKEMNRREALRNCLFGGLTLGGMNIVESITTKNEDIERTHHHITPKRKPKNAICVTVGDVRDHYSFPMRPQGWVTDGTPIVFVWPSERGKARGYVQDHLETPIEEVVFRLRMSRPEPPYYLRWRNGDYYLYTPVGALVKRAVYRIRQAEDAMEDDDMETYEQQALLALSDLRFGVILDLTAQPGCGQDVMDELAELDQEVRTAGLNLSPYWKRYTALMHRTDTR